MSRTISIRGKANLTAPADVTVVETSVNGNESTFERAVQRMTEMTVLLKDAAAAAGIPRGDLKTSNVDVRPAFRKKKIGKDKNGYDRFKDVPDGFSFRQNISVEFPNDNEKLGRVI